MAKRESAGRSGGVNFGKGSKVTVGGDVVGRDKVTKTTTTTNTGMSADDVAKLFDSIYKKIGQAPKEDQPDIRNAVDVIQKAAKQEAVDGKAPDEAAVKMASQSLAMTAPNILQDIADVAMATLSSPAAGVATIIRKVMAKVQQSGSKG
jgi:ribosomal protein L27